MLNSKQSDDFITWLNIDGVTKWTEPALKTKLKELFDKAIFNEREELIKKIEKDKKIYPWVSKERNVLNKLLEELEQNDK